MTFNPWWNFSQAFHGWQFHVWSFLWQSEGWRTADWCESISFLRFSLSSSIPAAELLQPYSVCFVINPQQPSLLMWRTKETWVSICFDNQSSVCLRTLTHTPSVAALHMFALIAVVMKAAGALGASFFSLSTLNFIIEDLRAEIRPLSTDGLSVNMEQWLLGGPGFTERFVH